MRSLKGLVSLCIILLLFTACRSAEEPYSLPQQLNDGWEVAAPEAVGMDRHLLAQAVSKNKSNGKVDGFLIVRHGKLVTDEYYNSYSATDQHKVWSVSKAVTSALVGVAIREGFITSENDSIYRYMGGYMQNRHAGKRSITLKHLMNMTSGIAWEEMGGLASAGHKVVYTQDWIEFVLQQPQAHRPGSVFTYSSGNTLLLAPVLKNATGMQADELAGKYLFQPLGIHNYEWLKCTEFWTRMEGGELPSAEKPDPPIEYDPAFAAYPNTATGLLMLPRDMAKLGQLYLDSGKWRGKQILDPEWVGRSVPSKDANSTYGYGWRHREYSLGNDTVNCYYATGFGLQSIYVFPAYELVVVFTQQHYRDMPEGEQHTQDVIQNYILKAVRE